MSKFATFAFFGAPNAGKSTLINALIGEKIAAVHRKPQMTRQNLLGILTEEGAQFIFIDTPGFHESAQILNQEWNAELTLAVSNCEFILALFDVAESPEEALLLKLAEVAQKKKVIFILNKCDLPQDKWKVAPEFFAARFPSGDLFSVSAKTGEGISDLKKYLRCVAPEGPYLYPEDEMTTASMRQIAVNTILENIMEVLEQELPYQIAVVIESYKESADGDVINAAIVVNRESQKGMVIGKGGATLKKIGMGARHALQDFLGRRVTLKLFVKVDHGWIKNPGKVKQYYDFKKIT